jgi:hypothetical protein
MNNTKEGSTDLGFGMSALYRITVLGKLSDDLTEKLYDMEISHYQYRNKHFSVIQGILPDQAALSGILNILYDMHFTVLSVKRQKRKES